VKWAESMVVTRVGQKAEKMAAQTAEKMAVSWVD
jgi:hypothetical protein